jgi:hypothetical protein
MTGPDPTYRLAAALVLRMVGRSLVSLAVLVALLSVLGVLAGDGWVIGGTGALLGTVLVGAWAWYLARAWAARLGSKGYAVRRLRGIGVRAATWTQVEQVVAATSGGTPCLVLRLRDGRSTRLPMPALAADPDAFASDVRRRVRDAFSPSGPEDP